MVIAEVGAYQDFFLTNWGGLSSLSPASIELGWGWLVRVVGLAEGVLKEGLFLRLASGSDGGGQKNDRRRGKLALTDLLSWLVPGVRAAKFRA